MDENQITEIASLVAGETLRTIETKYGEAFKALSLIPAIRKVGGKDGYYSDVALSEYAAKHRSWWERKENEDNGSKEEVAR